MTDEYAVLALIRERLELGRRQYGPLDTERDALAADNEHLREILSDATLRRDMYHRELNEVVKQRNAYRNEVERLHSALKDAHQRASVTLTDIAAAPAGGGS